MEDLKNLSAEAVMAPFVGRDTLTNRELFQQLALQLDIPEAVLDARACGQGRLLYADGEHLCVITRRHGRTIRGACGSLSRALVA